jgi:hypothetical protein
MLAMYIASIFLTTQAPVGEVRIFDREINKIERILICVNIVIITLNVFGDLKK